MGWLLGVVVVLVAVGALALLVPPVFGVALAGIAPLLLVIALIGVGGVWWRHSRTRIDAKPKADQPGSGTGDEPG